jgi:ribose transport system permease protein
VAALGSVLSAIVIQDYGTGGAVATALIAGAACGLASGVLVAFLKLPPFVTTLAMMTVARGLSLIVSAGQPIQMGDAGIWITTFGSGSIATIPYPVVLMAIVFVIAGIVLTFTRFGRLVKAIGSNVEAVRLSGIPVAYYTTAVYVISGVLAAAAGIVSTSRTGIGSANIGVGSELDAIAAVVIGGASLMGGRGGVMNTFIGVLVLGIIANMMNLARVPGYHQQVFMGCIIIGAMLLQYASNWFRK